MSPRAKKAQSSPLPEGSASLTHSTQGPTVSPTPRPIKQRLPEDVFAAYDAGMRVQAAELYRLLQKGPVHIEPTYPEVITWMRGRGVRIKTRMSAEGSFYELESDVPVG